MKQIIIALIISVITFLLCSCSGGCNCPGGAGYGLNNMIHTTIQQI